LSNRIVPSSKPQDSIEFIGAASGDVLLVPIALTALWTLAYQLVLVTRLPAWSVIGFFFGFSILSVYSVRRWAKGISLPGADYQFHPSHLFLLGMGIGCGVTVLFVRCPNQDDIVYFHRALTQLAHMSHPIFTRQTSVDLDAAAFSPVHLATSHEMLMAFLGHFLGIDPLYCYQVIGHALTAFSMPFVFYWCVRQFNLERRWAVIGALCAVTFLLFDKSGPASHGYTAFTRMWQGKAIVWVLVLPVALAITYRFISRGDRKDVIWLTLLAISSVGLSSSALYLIPATVGCACLAFLGMQLLQGDSRDSLTKHLQRCFLLAIPLVYPVMILLLLKLNIIPKPTDLRGFGPTYIPWREGIDKVVAGPQQQLRNVLIIIAVPLLIVRGRKGLFLFLYVCAIWLLCLNPLLAHRWMDNILAACYFRLNYLLPLPLLCGLLPVALADWSEERGRLMRNRILTGLAIIALALGAICSYKGMTITPKNASLEWKSPSEYQLLRVNTDFAGAAGKYISHSKLLAPEWTASCELPLLFPQMKVVAPRLVIHYFANAGNAYEGGLRRMAQAFVEGEKTNDPRRAAGVAAAFRLIVTSGRANAVAAPKSESQRVLAALQKIDPRWHRILEAGGLVLMLPASEASYQSNR